VKEVASWQDASDLFAVSADEKARSCI